MADEPIAQEAVNSEASASSETQNVSGQTPVTENVAPDSNAPGPVPYSRFKEVIDTRNQYESKFEELNNRLSAYEAAQAEKQKTNASEKYTQRLQAAGMAPEVASLLAEVMSSVGRDIVGEAVGPLQQESAATRVDQWVDKLARTHKDWGELEPEMEKILGSMPKQMQPMFISSPQGLEMLYAKAKLEKAQKSEQAAFSAGAKAAYDNKGLKAAVASTPGASAAKPNSAITLEAIGKMTTDEYRARHKEIVQAFESGQLYK